MKDMGPGFLVEKKMDNNTTIAMPLGPKSGTRAIRAAPRMSN
jgi:hypothetical protein